MKNWLIKKMMNSRKFWYAVIGILTTALTPKLGIPEELIREALIANAAIVSTLILGQGAADWGKEKK